MPSYKKTYFRTFYHSLHRGVELGLTGFWIFYKLLSSSTRHLTSVNRMHEKSEPAVNTPCSQSVAEWALQTQTDLIKGYNSRRNLWHLNSLQIWISIRILNRYYYNRYIILNT